VLLPPIGEFQNLVCLTLDTFAWVPECGAEGNPFTGLEGPETIQKEAFCFV